MSWRDRDYARDSEAGMGFGGGRIGGGLSGRLSGASVVTWLLGINCVVFVLNVIFVDSKYAPALAPVLWCYFSIDKAVHQFQVWRWLTYQFIHADLFHLLFNMIALFFFGPMMERWWGSRRFLAFYLLCGVCGAIVYSLFTLVPGLISAGSASPVVGASGSIYGILIGCAVLFPKQRVMLLIPPIPMSMRTLALILMGIVFLSLAVGSRNAGGEAAHLGGAALGFLLVRVPNVLNFADGLGGSLTQLKLKSLQRDAQRKRQKSEADEAAVDKILDKVRENGLQSLSAREKKILKNATDSKRNP